MILPLFFTLSFFLGILLASLTDFSFAQYMWLLPFVFLPKRWWLCAILFFFLFGVFRVNLYEKQAPGFVEYGFVQFEGQIVEEIDRRMDYQKITVAAEFGRVLVKISKYEDLSFGDLVSVSGELEMPSDDIEGFDYAAYLARYRVWLLMNRASVQLVEEASFSVRGFLYDFKWKLEQRLNSLLFEPEASFAAGLLLGSRKGMPLELTEAFKVTGLTHIVAISGYNISLIIAIVFWMLSFLPLRQRILVSSFIILLFVILVGASAAVLRAGIMGVMALLALYNGRRSQVFFALLWSATFMVLINPYVLVYDVGFQLSFASTFGLLVFVPLFQKYLPGRGVLAEAFYLSLSAQIATFPLTVYNFGYLSLMSPVVNVLVAPFLPFAMFFSALALVFGKSAALFAYVNLRAVELLALLFAELPLYVPVEFNLLDFLVSLLVLFSSSLFFYKSKLVRAFWRGS
ncbi:DUF4131 domain-containing protein [Candidatus Peregrinibacteria bacterium]|jgi:competence protein ComEC|nr:DUF4131 domain-containing protein [Candidatus Peregrinibacteria bacterium]MBT5516303.1 DUF4131 domain-containing protein [Candidatus Peregrinibacteria bacterium]MBT5823724.1 DUF4131 domain-containing protein [Candidatus Peregrinibacteria bacterium]